jgi:P63C domain
MLALYGSIGYYASMDKRIPAENHACKPGRARGGEARAKALPAKRRSEIGKKGAAIRWDPNVRTAEYGDDEHPLMLGGVSVPCFVLDDGERVLSQRGFFEVLGMRTGGGVMERFISNTKLEESLDADAIQALRNPLKMRSSRGGPHVLTYKGPLLVDVCNAILTSNDMGIVEKAYSEVAVRAYVIVRAVAKVGIIALIDEATGYEKERAANSLAQILEAFIAKELQPWVKTFPAEYYSELFRLRGLPFPSGSVKRPQFFGHLTNDIIYRRLAPGVLTELKRVVPKNTQGKPKGKLTQMLTPNVGYPKLRELLGAVVAIMQLSTNYLDFKAKLDRLRPAYGSTIPLPFQDAELTEDSGTGL